MAGGRRYSRRCRSECEARVTRLVLIVPELCGLHSRSRHLVARCQRYDRHESPKRHCQARSELRASSGARQWRNGRECRVVSIKWSLKIQQAASVFCVPGQLLHLSFYPQPSSGLLPLPSSLAIVITNSLEPHALSESAPERYNLRVFENLWAVRLLLREWNYDHGLELPSDVEHSGRVWLREALHLLSAKLGLSEEEAYVQISKDIERVLGADGKDKLGWKKEDIIQASGMRTEDFYNTFARTIEVRAHRFHLYKRAKHTIQESLRVIEFHRVCEAAAVEGVQEATLSKLGQLLNASHASLKDDYDCTVDSVDMLQKLCLESGSLGSRQTGE
jgi:galactokinase